MAKKTTQSKIAKATKSFAKGAVRGATLGVSPSSISKTANKVSGTTFKGTSSSKSQSTVRSGNTLNRAKTRPNVGTGLASNGTIATSATRRKNSTTSSNTLNRIKTRSK